MIWHDDFSSLCESLLYFSIFIFFFSCIIILAQFLTNILLSMLYKVNTTENILTSYEHNIKICVFFAWSETEHMYLCTSTTIIIPSIFIIALHDTGLPHWTIFDQNYVKNIDSLCRYKYFHFLPIFFRTFFDSKLSRVLAMVFVKIF